MAAGIQVNLESEKLGGGDRIRCGGVTWLGTREYMLFVGNIKEILRGVTRG